ncbi:MAG: hypothetical protein AAFN50_11940 [Pseudomonadota bacterium]
MNRLGCFGLVPLMIAGLLAGGCANSGFKLNDAAISGNPDAMWEEGQRAVMTGESLVDKGEKRLADGRKQVRDGEAKIATGNKRVLQAKEDYIAATIAAGAATTPKQVEEESKRLRAIGKRWEVAIDEIRDGNRLVERGNKSIDQAHSEIREGRGLMAQGSTLMRNSQRSRLGEEMLPIPATDTL